MDERRLEMIRQRAQQIDGAAATGAAHDYHAAGLADPPRDLGDVGFACAGDEMVSV
jgi:hypothetical protein